MFLSAKSEYLIRFLCKERRIATKYLKKTKNILRTQWVIAIIFFNIKCFYGAKAENILTIIYYALARRPVFPYLVSCKLIALNIFVLIYRSRNQKES